MSVLRLTIVPKIAYCILLIFNHSKVTNHMWNSWNRRIASLTFARYCHSCDAKIANLHDINQWSHYKAMNILKRKLCNKQTFEFLSLRQQKPTRLLRPNQGIQYELIHGSGTIEDKIFCQFDLLFLFLHKKNSLMLKRFPSKNCYYLFLIDLYFILFIFFIMVIN